MLSDPIGLKGGLNTYAYVELNSRKFVDHFGLEKHIMLNTWDAAYKGAVADRDRLGIFVIYNHAAQHFYGSMDAKQLHKMSQTN